MAKLAVRGGSGEKQVRHSADELLGISTDDPLRIAALVREGFAFSRLVRFQRVSQMPWEEISRFVGIPQRTLSRRQAQGRLAPEEADRLWRASVVFGKAVALFEGDVAAAREWLERPQGALGRAIPLQLAGTDVGARAVESLIGRLEHGVFT